MKIASTQHGDERGLQPEVLRRPEEIDAAQEADEQRRVAERESAPPILATRKMKKTTTWALCAASGVGADQRADQDHGGAGGADHARDQRCRRRGCAALTSGRAAQVAGDQNAAGHHIEREQQHDEAQIFGQHACTKAASAAGAP